MKKKDINCLDKIKKWVLHIKMKAGWRNSLAGSALIYNTVDSRGRDQPPISLPLFFLSVLICLIIIKVKMPKINLISSGQVAEMNLNGVL